MFAIKFTNSIATALSFMGELVHGDTSRMVRIFNQRAIDDAEQSNFRFSAIKYWLKKKKQYLEIAKELRGVNILGISATEPKLKGYGSNAKTREVEFQLDYGRVTLSLEWVEHHLSGGEEKEIISWRITEVNYYNPVGSNLQPLVIS